MTPPTATRRHVLATAAAALVLPGAALASPIREIDWEDLVPPGVPPAEIVGMGTMDRQNDTWRPTYDENATKLNTSLDGKTVRLPGFIIPMDIGAKGVTSFILVPYVGACIHVPPPPANQLVFVSTTTPWPQDDLWDPVWVTGLLSARLQSTDIAEIGYRIDANKIESYEW